MAFVKPCSRHVALYATKHKYPTESSRELLGLGLANMVGACFLSFTVGGAFSRSAVNDHVGARTPMSLLISGLVVIPLTMLICPALYAHACTQARRPAPLMARLRNAPPRCRYYLPKGTLAAIVMIAVSVTPQIAELQHTDAPYKRTVVHTGRGCSAGGRPGELQRP